MDPDRDATAWFEALFAAHYGDLMRYATRPVGTDAASDVVSSPFLVAWRRATNPVLDCTRTAAKVRLHCARRRFADRPAALDAAHTAPHPAARAAAVLEGKASP